MNGFNPLSSNRYKTFSTMSNEQPELLQSACWFRMCLKVGLAFFFLGWFFFTEEHERKGKKEETPHTHRTDVDYECTFADEIKAHDPSELFDTTPPTLQRVASDRRPIESYSTLNGLHKPVVKFQFTLNAVVVRRFSLIPPPATHPNIVCFCVYPPVNWTFIFVRTRAPFWIKPLDIVRRIVLNEVMLQWKSWIDRKNGKSGKP
ncbi:hypothetical protein GWI33_008294 [Rhynchophorus ferrugineus]|uniref:Uncharacterized protein n=1 Tax=Rhynchophorus ferrugineus TaxID=354439 RepID=A0A834MMJ1_RHYFE|nr:hypothetical protein GWI33_008294 [Rhynchophorus ferrugineus]